MNPIDAFLSEFGPQEKTAFLGQVARHVPEQLALGAATAGSAALVAGAGYGAHALYNAVTKGRDFRKMLAFNEDLAYAHKENPKYVNAAFNTLHRMNTDFAKDPLVAGAFVRQMSATPEAAFGLAGQAAGFAPRPGAVEQAALSGLSAGVAPNASMGRTMEVKRREAMIKAMGQEPKNSGRRPIGGGSIPMPNSQVSPSNDAAVERIRRMRLA